MRTLKEIERLVLGLHHGSCGKEECGTMDIAPWNPSSMGDNLKLVVEKAVTMANVGGGTVVFGVAQQRTERGGAMCGVPWSVDVQHLIEKVSASTKPKITPVFAELRIAEGDVRVLVMRIPPGIPPYHSLLEERHLRSCQYRQYGLPSPRERSLRCTSDSDYTAEIIPGAPERMLSPSALEHLRSLAAQEQAPADLLQLRDRDFLSALGLLRQGKLTRAALILAGTERALSQHVPAYAWVFFRMKGSTQYSLRDCQAHALPKAVHQLGAHLASCNPETSVEHNGSSFKTKVYPEKALREVLLNAFCHTDYHARQPIVVKVYPERIECDSPGVFVPGITPKNILHHQSLSRNPLLVEALGRLHLVNRSNLGISRMFGGFLCEGKQPPVLEQVGNFVRVTLKASPLYPEFCALLRAYAKRGHTFTVDELLILHHLLQHVELTTGEASSLTQRHRSEVEEVLLGLQKEGCLVGEEGKRGLLWHLHPGLYETLTGATPPFFSRRTVEKNSTIRIRKIRGGQVNYGNVEVFGEEYRQRFFH